MSFKFKKIWHLHPEIERHRRGRSWRHRSDLHLVNFSLHTNPCVFTIQFDVKLLCSKLFPVDLDVIQINDFPYLYPEVERHWRGRSWRHRSDSHLPRHVHVRRAGLQSCCGDNRPAGRVLLHGSPRVRRRFVDFQNAAEWLTILDYKRGWS